MTDDLDFDDEDGFEEWLGGAFEAGGWRVHHQVSPKGSQNRADMLVYHDQHGWIGIECKYMSNGGDGAKVGEAIKQITEKYRGEYYPHGAGEVDLWVFAGYINYRARSIGRARQVAKSTLWEHGIGTLWANPQQHDYLNMNFSQAATETVIDIIDPCNARLGNTDRIREEAAQKIPETEEELGTCQYDTRGQGCSAPAVETHQLGRYEVRLCQYHTAQKDFGVWKDLKRARRQIAPDA